MSLSKAFAALEALSDYDLETFAYVVERRRSVTSAERHEAPEHKAPKSAAERQREKREREKASRDVTKPRVMSRDAVTKNVTDVVTSRDESRDSVTPRAPASELSSPSASSSFTEKTEEKRGERERAHASASRTVTGPVTQDVTRDVTEEPSLTRHADTLRNALIAGYKKAGVAPPMKYLGGLPYGPVIDIARSVEPKDVNRFVDGFFANARARKEGYPIHFAATNPGQYLVEPQRQRSSTPIGLMETDEEFEEDLKRIQEASARTRAASFAALAEEEGRTNA